MSRQRRARTWNQRVESSIDRITTDHSAAEFVAVAFGERGIPAGSRWRVLLSDALADVWSWGWVEPVDANTRVTRRACGLATLSFGTDDLVAEIEFGLGAA